MYSLPGYGQLVGDGPRVDAYESALREVLEPGASVADIGCGTGLLALLACRNGAGTVYAIESGDVIQIAREIAAANGLADRIEFIQADSTEVTLDERVQVVISDLRGILPLYQHHLPAIVDARRRLLAPGGVLIPVRDELRAAVVEAPELQRPHVEPWRTEVSGFDHGPALQRAVNLWSSGRVEPDQLLCDPETWATLDYATLTEPDVRGAAAFAVRRPGVGHGVLLWFDTVMTERVRLPGGPSAPRTIYGSAFFPWPESVDLAPGETVSVKLEARLVGPDYVWRWASVVRRRDGGEKATFEQSTFFASVLSPARLARRGASYEPRLTADGEVDGFVLAAMSGGATLREIAARLVDRFPGRFSSPEAALDRVADLSEKYSR